VPATTTTTEVSSTTECSTMVTSSSSAPPPGVPQFPLGSGLAVVAVGIMMLSAFLRVRSSRKPVPA
jgi:hypothetical protein